MNQLSFQYRAIDPRGGRRKGALQAANQQDAYQQIVSMGLRPLKIALDRKKARSGGKITFKDLSHMTYQLSVLMEARIPIVDGLRSIAAQEPNARMQSIMNEVATSIESGTTVTQALAPHRRLFGDVYLETIHAAEVSGNMIEVLAHLADMLDRQYEITKMVKSALMYPMMVVIALTMAMTFLMIFVVPRFATMFASRGVDLPLMTQIVLSVSEIIRGYWYLIIGGLVAGFFALRSAWAKPASRRRIDAALHKVRILRNILQGVAVSRFAHVFGISIRSGLSLIDALELSGRASGRPSLQAETEHMCERINVGHRLTDALSSCRYLPNFAQRMLSAGEEAAELSRMCEIVARHYDREVTHTTKNISTLIEPIMVIGLAAIVLVIALAIFLPMWNMAALVG